MRPPLVPSPRACGVAGDARPESLPGMLSAMDSRVKNLSGYSNRRGGFMTWTCEMAGDALSGDYLLCFEILQGSEYRARIHRSADGALKLMIYPTKDASIEIPTKWLAEVLERADREL